MLFANLKSLKWHDKRHVSGGTRALYIEGYAWFSPPWGEQHQDLPVLAHQSIHEYVYILFADYAITSGAL